MGAVFGMVKSPSVQRINQLVVQQSAYGVPMTIGWGTNRTQANLIWYNGFQAKAQKTSSGKGGGSTTTGYTYSASVMMAVGEGAISGIRTVYKDQNIYVNGSKTALQQAGLSMMTGLAAQTAWGYLTTNYPTQAIGYSRTAYVYAANYPLTSSATLSNHSFEVQWAYRATVSGSTIDDANASDVITDFLTNPVYGVPLWGSGLIASLTAYQNYCTAAGLFLSPVINSTRTAQDFLTEILDATNSDAVWSGGQLKIVPYGDTAITNNGVTYTPNLTPLYALGEGDFVVANPGDDPIKIALAKQADAYNSVQVEFLDRALNYNTNTSLAADQASIATYGMRREDPHSLACICDAGVAAAVAQLRVQRLANLRRTFVFNLDWRYCLLEPMDLVTLTSGDLVGVLVRIVKIAEKQDGELEVTAEEMLVGSSHAAVYTRQQASGTIVNTSISPGSVSAPVLINPPRTLTNGDTQVWLAVAGSSLNWGGCEVFTSLDNVNYQYQGNITQPARYGTLTSALTNVADPDTTSSFGVDLTPSLGSLNTATAADANGGSTLCLIDNELITYQAATLTSTYHYTLGTLLRRGQLGTTPAAHSSGAEFIRLDGGLFKYGYTSNQSGKTVYVKFCSYNIYGQALEDISTVATYTITLNPTSATVSTGWTAITGGPANVFALTGSEAIQNSILQGSLTGGSVVPAQSSSVTGQTAWATYGNLTPTQLTQSPRNMLYNPTGLLGLQGWTINVGTFGTNSFNAGVGDGPYFVCATGSNAAPQSLYQTLRANSGSPYSLSAQLNSGGLSTTGTQARIYLEWLDSSSSHLGYSSFGTISGGVSSWSPVAVANQIAPASTYYVRIVLDINGSGAWTNTSTAWRYLKLEQNTVCTPFSDDVTYGAGYQGGTTIDALKPAQANADVTGSNTALGIAGQGTGATTNVGTLATLNTVGTSNINSNAVTNTVATSGDLAGATRSTSSAYTFASVTITTTGGPVLIGGNFTERIVSGPNPLNCTGLLERDGATIGGAIAYGLINYDFTQVFLVVDTPSAGTHVYSIVDSVGPGVTMEMHYYGLYATELKR